MLWYHLSKKIPMKTFASGTLFISVPTSAQYTNWIRKRKAKKFPTENQLYQENCNSSIIEKKK